VPHDDNPSLLDNIKWKMLEKAVNNLAMLRSPSANDMKLFCESASSTIHLSVRRRPGPKSAFGMTLVTHISGHSFSQIQVLPPLSHKYSADPNADLTPDLQTDRI
jgi:hypothetical protein